MSKSTNLSSPTGYGAAQTDFLDLFILQGKTKWTRSVALWDALPKYVFTGDQTKKTTTLRADEAIRTNVVYAGQTWHFTMEPAQVAAQGPRAAFFSYPGEREELVARALRYLSVQGTTPVSIWSDQKKKHQPQARVAFTLYELGEILRQWGHTYNSVQLDEALKILLRSRLTVRAAGATKEAAYDGPLLLEYFELNEGGGDRGKKRVVVLNSLELAAIQEGQYRSINFEKMMSLDSPLSRRIYEYVITRHLGADKPPLEPTGKLPRPFELKLSTIIRECCIQAGTELRATVKRARKAILELQEQGILWDGHPFDEVPEYEATKGRARIKDVTWKLYLSRDSVSDIIAANAEAWPAGEEAKRMLPEASLKKTRKDAAAKHL